MFSIFRRYAKRMVAPVPAPVRRTRIGIVGCGNVSKGYVWALRGNPEVEIWGVTDVDRMRAAAFGAENGCRVYSTLEEMLSDPSVEVVLNLTIHTAHAEVIRRCLCAGRHVFSEKPLAMTYGEARGLVEISETRGLRLGCAPVTFLGEAQQTVGRMLQDGRVGQVRLIYAETNHGRVEDWHPNPLPFYEVGPLFDVAVYPLTIATAFFGPAVSVEAWARSLMPLRRTAEGREFNLQTPEFYVALISWEKGPVMRLTSNFYVGPTSQVGMEFHGDRGCVHLACPFSFGASVKVADYGKREFTTVEPVRTPYQGIEWSRGLVDMLEALREGRPHRATATHAAHIVEIVEAIGESVRVARRVDLRSRFTPPALMPWSANRVGERAAA